jgi:hypothetical protein
MDISAPTGWHWGIGERGEAYYSHWLYSDETFPFEDDRYDGAVNWGYEIEVFWDKGNKHTVIASKMFYDADGDIVTDERVRRPLTYDSEDEAAAGAVELASNLL